MLIFQNVQTQSHFHSVHIYTGTKIVLILKIQEKLHFRALKGIFSCSCVSTVKKYPLQEKYYDFSWFLFTNATFFLPLCSFYKQQPDELIFVFNQRTPDQRFKHFRVFDFIICFNPFLKSRRHHTRVKPGRAPPQITVWVLAGGSSFRDNAVRMRLNLL